MLLLRSLWFPFQGPLVTHYKPAVSPGAGVRQLDYSRPESNPFRLSPNLRADLRSLGNLDSPSHDIAEVSALAFTPVDQTRGEIVGKAFPLRAQSSLLPQVRSWGSSVCNDTSSVKPAHPQNPNDDPSDDVHTFCEWTDEHGTCNMDILGDRVWMSHHLSRYHNVVGNEKSQRACLWRGCTDTMNKGSLARHVVSRHLRAGASCGFCSKVYSRADVARRHTKKCRVANGVSVQHEQTKW
ncbi:hypothetical protein J3R83DRAFT_9961 [Lanmaoa asiatica]|nr:hypothetical protein J3R83DRAFT_9961 [Lanmaoa asiatica]